MNRDEYLFNKLKCPRCGDYYKSVYSNEELLKKYPFREGDKSYRNLAYASKIIKLRRKVKCSTCGKRKKISKKLLMQISKLKKEKKDND